MTCVNGFVQLCVFRHRPSDSRSVLFTRSGLDKGFVPVTSGRCPQDFSTHYFNSKHTGSGQLSRVVRTLIAPGYMSSFTAVRNLRGTPSASLTVVQDTGLRGRTLSTNVQADSMGTVSTIFRSHILSIPAMFVSTRLVMIANLSKTHGYTITVGPDVSAYERTRAASENRVADPGYKGWAPVLVSGILDTIAQCKFTLQM